MLLKMLLSPNGSTHQENKRNKVVAAAQTWLIFIQRETILDGNETAAESAWFPPTVTAGHECSVFNPGLLAELLSTVAPRATADHIPFPLQAGSVVSQFMDFCTAFFQRV